MEFFMDTGKVYITKRYISKITRAAQRYAGGAIKDSGVGLTEYECLHLIRKNEGAHQEWLSDMLNIDKSAVTRMLLNLEKKGYVMRRKDDGDKRSNKVYSTPKALDVKFDEINAESIFYEWLFDGLTPQEEQSFAAVLEKLYRKSKDARAERFKTAKTWEQAKTNKKNEV